MTKPLPTKKGHLEPKAILKEGIFKPSFLSGLCFSAQLLKPWFGFFNSHSFIHLFIPCKTIVGLNARVVVGVGGDTKIHHTGSYS